MKKLSVYILMVLSLGSVGAFQSSADDEVETEKPNIMIDGGNIEWIDRVRAAEQRSLIADEKAKQRSQKADQLGLGTLERMAISPNRINYEDIKMFRGADTRQLFSLLNDRDFVVYWDNIALVIGMVADEQSAKKLADFAATPFPQGDNERGRQIAAREGAIWGLMYAINNRPMPWVNEFVIAHGTEEQWIRNFGEENLSPGTAKKLAFNTWDVLARTGSEESLAMLNEIQARVSNEVQPQSVDPNSNSAVIRNLIDIAKSNIKRNRLE